MKVSRQASQFPLTNMEFPQTKFTIGGVPAEQFIHNGEPWLRVKQADLEAAAGYTAVNFCERASDTEDQPVV